MKKYLVLLLAICTVAPSFAADRIQLRRDSFANWSGVNPTLAQGEFGYVTDTNKAKVGDGITKWNQLAYLTSGATGGGTWGSITGTLADQTDLQTVLSGKVATSHIDTDTSLSALHHTLGTGQYQSAAGNHLHAGTYEPSLGNPSTDDFILSKKTNGTVNWVAQQVISQSLYNVENYGAKHDVKHVFGQMSTASNVLKVNVGSFTVNDVGQKIAVWGAYSSGRWLQSTIAGVTSSTQVILSRTAVQKQCRIVTTAATTIGSTTVTATGGNFLQARDQYKMIAIEGAGYGGGWLYARIMNVLGSTSITVDIPASATLSNKVAWIAYSDVLYGTDDTTAVNNALNAMPAEEGGVLYFPTGNYWLESKFSISNMPITIQGDSVAQSVLYWPLADSDAGFDIQFNSRSQLASVNNLRLITTADGIGTALSITDNNVTVGTNAIKHIISKVGIEGLDKSWDTGWDVGIDLTDTSDTQLEMISVVHGRFTPGTSNIRLSDLGASGTTASTFNANRLQLYFGTNALEFQGSYEGVTVLNSTMVGQNYGIYVGTNSGEPLYHFAYNHINCYVADIYFDTTVQAEQINISNNLLYLVAATGRYIHFNNTDSTVGAVVSGHISRNTFYSSTDNYDSIRIENGAYFTNLQISDNIIRAYTGDKAVYVGGTVTKSNVVLRNNTVYGGGTYTNATQLVVDSGATDKQMLFSDGTNNISGAASLYWDKTNSRVGLGTTSPAVGVHIEGTANQTNIRSTCTASSGPTVGPSLRLYEDDGAAISAGDRLGAIILGGARDTSHTLTTGAAIGAYAAENWSGTSTPTYLSISTTGSGSTSETERVRVQPDGIIMTGPKPSTYTSTDWKRKSGWINGARLTAFRCISTTLPVGTIVQAHSNAWGIKASVASSGVPIGAVFANVSGSGAACTAGKYCWVADAGVADILLKNSTACTAGQVAITSDTAGRASCTNSPDASVAHWQEIGHPVDSTAGGTDVLIPMTLHFNSIGIYGIGWWQIRRRREYWAEVLRK